MKPSDELWGDLSLPVFAGITAAGTSTTLGNQPYGVLDIANGGTGITAQLVRCDYCQMSDFDHGQCQRCGAPEPRR